ncbi:phosphoenolpyruvate hydrolase family protein [Kribbella swartbergensis]
MTIGRDTRTQSHWSKPCSRHRTLVYGGPVAEPADAECVLRKTTGIHGFYGASSLDASPSNEPFTDQTRAFTSITF